MVDISVETAFLCWYFKLWGLSESLYRKWDALKLHGRQVINILLNISYHRENSPFSWLVIQESRVISKILKPREKKWHGIIKQWAIVLTMRIWERVAE